MHNPPHRRRVVRGQGARTPPQHAMSVTSTVRRMSRCLSKGRAAEIVVSLWRARCQCERPGKPSGTTVGQLVSTRRRESHDGGTANQVFALHAADGTSAASAHSEKLQVGADFRGSRGRCPGICGALAAEGAAALRCSRFVRIGDSGLLGVAGMFDFDWHLPAVGLVGGWCSGLATRRESGG